jgi:hypothetical protein
MLAPIRLEDSDDVAAQKLALVAGYPPDKQEKATITVLAQAEFVV